MKLSSPESLRILNLALTEGKRAYSGRFRFTSTNFGTSSINGATFQNSYNMLGSADSVGWSKENRYINYLYDFNLNGPEPLTSYVLPALDIMPIRTILIRPIRAN